MSVLCVFAVFFKFLLLLYAYRFFYVCQGIECRKYLCMSYFMLSVT